MDNQIILAGITTDVLFTTFVTIFIFSAGLFFKWRYDINKEKQINKGKREFYLNTIKYLLKAIQLQVKLHNKLSLQIKDKRPQTFLLKENTELYINLESFENNEELYSIFVSGIKDKNEIKFIHYSNIINTIGFLKEHRKIALFDFEVFYKEFRKYNDDWNVLIIKLISYIEKLTYKHSLNKSAKTSDNFISDIENVASKWQKLDNHLEIYIVEENLIIPIFKICKKNRSDERAITLIEYTRNANIAFTNYDDVKDVYSKIFKQLAGLTFEQGKIFKEAYNYYSAF